jgi:pilus assembly protein CpaF
MRAQWLAIGELLGGEAMQAMEVMSRGHCGLTTIHASSPEDALTRLETMCLKANLGLGLGEIRSLITSALQVIVYQERLPEGRRRVLQIVELRGLENGRYVLQPLFRYDFEAGRLEATGAKASWE